MDDLVAEFVTETTESLSVLDRELVRFEQSPKDKDILGNIFRMMHTIKGTCGFLGLPRLEKVAHAGEDVLGRFRDGTMEPTPNSVTLVLKCIDRIRSIVDNLASEGSEGAGDDVALIGELKGLLEAKAPAATASAAPAGGPVMSAGGFPVAAELLAEVEASSAKPKVAEGGFPVAAELLAEVEAATAKPKVAEGGFPVAAEFLEEFAMAMESKKGAPAAAAPKPAAVAAPAASRQETVVAAAPSVAKAEPVKEKADAGKDRGPAQTIRVNVDVLENLMTLVSEMVLTRNQLLQLTKSVDNSVFKEPIERLSRTTSELQEGVMKTRMQPIGNAWSKLPRIVRDLANELGKKINLVMQGEETELDRQVLELIQDPLTHMVRNSADHGLERPEDRRAAGKEEVGTILLRAFHEGGHIILEISDDGRGINTNRVREKIVERGLATANEVTAMDDATVNQYIMRAGFSTAEKVTKVSGRGVGMDVVRANIEKIGGTIEFRSTMGQGSTFVIKIPLTLAIVSSLIVESGGERFALPQISVNEVVRVSENSEHRIESIRGAPILRLRNQLLPLVNLSQLLNLEGTGAPWHASRNTYEGYVVICHNGSQTLGVIIDSIADVEEIVVKPLSKILGSTKFFSGNTILGDGRVVLILDVNGLSGTLSQEAVQAQKTSAPQADSGPPKDNILRFRAGREGLHAVPLSKVERIEKFDMKTLEVVQGDYVIQYRNGFLPLIALEGQHGIRREGHQQVLVFGKDNHLVGLAIEAIVDIVQDNINVRKPSQMPGLHGSAIVAGKAVDVIDTDFLLSQVPAPQDLGSLGAVA